MVSQIGMYRKDGTIYKVQKAVHGSGNLYAKQLVLRSFTVTEMQTVEGEVDEQGEPVKIPVEVEKHAVSFEYDKGAVYRLSDADMMTLAEAKEFGALYGVCCKCGALLTDEKSIEAGIGPVCAESGFMSGAPVKLYADDVKGSGYDKGTAYQQAQANRENSPAPEATTRKITLGANKYGDIFLVRFDYNDPQFAALKDEIKATDWNATKRRWDGDLKAWTVDAKAESARTFIARFARSHDFTVSPEAQGLMEFEAVKAVYDNPAVETTQEAIAQEITRQTAGLPMTFADLVKEV